MTPASLRRLVASGEGSTLEFKRSTGHVPPDRRRGDLGQRMVRKVTASEDVSQRCQVGWTISGVLGRVGRRWRIIEAWNVYPG